jgi:hypothetical protein
MPELRKATPADAEICMKLYELRREPELRKARNFINFEFHPAGIDDVLRLMQSLGTQENAWARMVFSYWDYAASLLLNDVVHPVLFFSWNGEMIFLYAKIQPYLKELREKSGMPEFLAGMEKAVLSWPPALERIRTVQERIAKMATARQGSRSA